MMEAGTAIAVGQVSAKALSTIWKYYSDVKDAKDMIQSLVNELQDLQNVALKVQHLMKQASQNKDMPTIITLSHTLEQSLSTVKNLEDKLNPEASNKAMKRVGKRALKWPFQKKEVEEWTARLQSFKLTLSLAIATDQTSLLTSIRDKQLADEQEQLLRKLPVASDAAHNSYHRQHESQCMTNTRTELLQELEVWGTEHPRPILWLSGMAGTGKSTIARTIARIFDEQKVLGGSFFFSRSSGEANNAANFVGTFASQLARTSENLRSCICDAITGNSDALRQGLRNQWKTFIAEPLSKVKFGRPPTFNLVIDALDECAPDDDIRLLLQLCVEVSEINNIDLGILITSRPEIVIRHRFKQMPQVTHYDLDLRDIPAETVEHDISVYLSQTLGSIGLDQGLPDWPSKTDIETLTRKSGCLFIYAATICLFISDTSWDPVERLTDIINKESPNAGPTSTLDDMYLHALRVSLVEGRTGSEVTKLCDRFRIIVGSIVTIRDELSINSLAQLLSLSERYVEACLNSLHAVLNVPKESCDPVRTLHPSFREYLLDEARCGDKRIFQEEAEIHERLYVSCFKLLSLLTRNICRMPTPGSPPKSTDTKILDKRLPKHLRYACRYWTEHLKCARLDSSCTYSKMRALKNFFRTKFLNWLEAMSLLGQMTQAVLMVIATTDLVQVKPRDIHLPGTLQLTYY